MSRTRLLHFGVVLVAVVGPLLSASRGDAAYSDRVTIYPHHSVQNQSPKAESSKTPATPTPISVGRNEVEISHAAITSYQDPFEGITSAELDSVLIEVGTHDFHSTNRQSVIARPTLLTSHVLLRI